MLRDQRRFPAGGDFNRSVARTEADGVALLAVVRRPDLVVTAEPAHPGIAGIGVFEPVVRRRRNLDRRSRQVPAGNRRILFRDPVVGVAAAQDGRRTGVRKGNRRPVVAPSRLTLRRKAAVFVEQQPAVRRDAVIRLLDRLHVFDRSFAAGLFGAVAVNDQDGRQNRLRANLRLLFRRSAFAAMVRYVTDGEVVVSQDVGQFARKVQQVRIVGGRPAVLVRFVDDAKPDVRLAFVAIGDVAHEAAAVGMVGNQPLRVGEDVQLDARSAETGFVNNEVGGVVPAVHAGREPRHWTESVVERVQHAEDADRMAGRFVQLAVRFGLASLHGMTNQAERRLADVSFEAGVAARATGFDAQEAANGSRLRRRLPAADRLALPPFAFDDGDGMVLRRLPARVVAGGITR
jgi:hypothetical protein